MTRISPRYRSAFLAVAAGVTMLVPLVSSPVVVGASALPPANSVPGELVPVAGGSLGPSLGDGGPATRAQLNSPSGIAVDSNGNVFIADTDDNTIREVRPSGIITTFAGTGVAGDTGDGGAAIVAELNHPQGVAVDSGGNVYIADTGNNVIRVVDPTGVITTFAGDGTAGFDGDGGSPLLAQLDAPVGVAAGPNGEVAIADTGNSVIRIVKYRPFIPTVVHSFAAHAAKPRVTIFRPRYISTAAGIGTDSGNRGDGGDPQLAFLNFPMGVAFDAAGNLTIADTSNSSIRYVNFAKNTISTLFHVTYPTGVAVTSAGMTYAVDSFDNQIFSWRSGSGLKVAVGTGESGLGGYGGQATAAQINQPQGVGVDQYGDVFFTDTGNQRAGELVVARAPEFLQDTPSLVTTAGASYSYLFVAGAVPKATYALTNAPTWLHINIAGGLVTGSLPAGTTSFSFGVTAHNTYGTTPAGPFVVTVPQVTTRAGAVGPVSVATTTTGLEWYTNFTGNSISETTPAGDTRTFTNATVKGPFGITVGPGGNLWFTNNVGNSIGRITPSGTITNFTSPTINKPLGIALGPDGNLWFTNNLGNSIGRITPSGIIKAFTAPAGVIKGPDGIATGPDGKLWFTNNTGGSIGTISTSGVVTRFAGATVSSPVAIVQGPDHAMWFTNSGNSSIGHITSAGTITNYTGAAISTPQGIALGPDNALWFTNGANNSVGRITAAGTSSVYFMPGISDPLGISSGPSGTMWFANFAGSSIGRMSVTTHAVAFFGNTARPNAITLGPDGNLWFTSPITNEIGRISPSGTIATFAAIGISNPLDITAGPDGNLWFTNFGDNSIGRISTTGAVSIFYRPAINGPVGITAGPDGNLWFTNDGNNTIGRITPAGVATSYTDASVNTPLNIAPGPDGLLWFTNYGGNTIGSITTNGFIANYAGGFINKPFDIVAGPDGNLWFTNSGNNSIGKITTDGTVSHFAAAGISTPQGIAVGSDGALWFTNYGANTIGRLSTSYDFSVYNGLNIASPVDIAAGPDVALWFTNPSSNSIGHITG